MPIHHCLRSSPVFSYSSLLLLFLLPLVLQNHQLAQKKKRYCMNQPAFLKLTECPTLCPSFEPTALQLPNSTSLHSHESPSLKLYLRCFRRSTKLLEIVTAGVCPMQLTHTGMSNLCYPLILWNR